MSQGITRLKKEVPAMPYVTVKQNLVGSSFIKTYKPYSVTKKIALSYFLKVDLGNESGIKDFGTFVGQAMREKYFPVAGPTFTLPSEEMNGQAPVLLNIVLEKREEVRKSARDGRKNVVYAASPTRFVKRKEEIMAFVTANDKACLHPLHALPFEYFESGGISRENTMAFCCELVDICDEFWLFGISDGTLLETAYLLEKNKKLKKPKTIRVLVYEFDPHWKQILKKQRQYSAVIKNYAKTLAEINNISPIGL